MNVGSLFSGVGLLDYGLHLAGFEHAWLCEKDEWRRGILAKRFPGARVYDDVRSVGGDCERVDVIAGGFPCRGISSAGKREGFGHPETVLWREMARCVRELRPRHVIVENVSALIGLHGGECFAEVLGDLAACGFDIWWNCVPAAAFGAPHRRDRVFIVASHADGARADAHATPGRSRQAVGERDSATAGADGADEERNGSQRGKQNGRSDASGGAGAASDAERRVHTSGRQRDVPESEGAREGEGTQRQRVRTDAADGRGVAVDWGEYRAAIERWEAILGPAPEPLVRRVDDGRTGRVERSSGRIERQRLSALGDGVLVQAGYFIGAMLMASQADPLTEDAA